MMGYRTDIDFWLWDISNKVALLMDVCNFSRYLIICHSWVVVKRVLSIYSLLPQATFKYKLDWYPDPSNGLTPSSSTLNTSVNFTKNSIEFSSFIPASSLLPPKLKVTYKTCHLKNASIPILVIGNDSLFIICWEKFIHFINILLEVFCLST